MGLFAVTRERGGAWDVSRALREQDAWDEHAAFMDGLADSGFIVLGGPVGSGVCCWWWRRRTRPRWSGGSRAIRGCRST